MPEKVSEAKELVRRVASPRPIGDSVKAAIGRAARRLGWSYSRTKDIWYGAAHVISAEEMDLLRDAARTQGEAADAVFHELAQLVGLATELLDKRAHQTGADDRQGRLDFGPPDRAVAGKARA